MASAPSPQHPPSNPLPSPSRPSPTRREIERAVQAPRPDPPRSPNRLLARPLVCPANNATVREETAADARSSTPGRRQGPRRCRDLTPRRGSSSPLGTPPSHPSAAARQDMAGMGMGMEEVDMDMEDDGEMDMEMEMQLEEARWPEVASPYCYEDYDLGSLCIHLEEDHPYEPHPAVSQSQPCSSSTAQGRMRPKLEVEEWRARGSKGSAPVVDRS